MNDPILIPTKPYFLNQLPDFESPNYADDLFLPNDNSLTHIDISKEMSQVITKDDIKNLNLKDLVWKSPSEIFKEKPFILYNNISVEDIKQGLLGNCYFLSALSSLAEFPKRIEKILINNCTSKNGCYSFNFYIQGKQKVVTIDDKIPVFHNNNWALAHSANNTIWVQLIEKAWAKVNSSYTMTIGGLPSEALSSLTEAPVITYIHRKYESSLQLLWEIIKDADDQNYIICTQSSDNDTTKKMGLIQSHAYSIISCYEIDGKKLLKLRNPWGNFEWTGDYSDKSKLWTDDLKQKVNFKDSNDGIFYILYDDYLKYFPVTFICKFFDGYHYKWKKVKQFSENTMVGCRFKITKPTKAIFGLHQKQKRFYNKTDYQPNHAKLFLVKYNKHDYYNNNDNYDQKNVNNKYEYIASHEGNREIIYLDLINTLDVGEYLLFGKIKWSYFDKECSIVFSTYSDNIDLDFNHLDKSLISDDYLLKIFESYINKKCHYKNFDPNNINGLSYVVSVTDTDTGFYFLSFKNENDFKPCELSLTVEMNNKVDLLSKNIIVKKTEDNKLKYKIVVAPSSSELILFEQLDNFWICNLKVQDFILDWDKIYTYDDDMKFILEHKDLLVKDKFILNHCYYSELKRENSLLIVLQNESEFDYMVHGEFKNLVNCLICQPYSIVFKIKSGKFKYIKLKLIEKDDIDFELVYSYKKIYVNSQASSMCDLNYSVNKDRK